MPRVEPILTTAEIRENYIDSDTILVAHEKRQYAEFDRWLAQHDEGQRIKGIQGLLDYRPLPRDVRRYIEVYLESAVQESADSKPAKEPDHV